MAHFEVYVLNFNGAHFLPECLQALREVERGPHTLAVNVVDNGSDDGSADLCTAHFPEVNYIPLGFNHGFSKGNNLGIAQRRNQLRDAGIKVDFQVLLNNDTRVGPNWLLGAAEVFERDPSVGIVGSKSVFYDRFVELTFTCVDGFCPQDYGSNDSRALGVFLQKSYSGDNIHLSTRRSKFIGFYPRQGGGLWSQPEATWYVPIDDPSRPATLRCTFENHHPAETHVRVGIQANGEATTHEATVTRLRPESLKLQFRPSQYLSLLQNAGSYVTPEWEGGDRGFLEPDDGRFDQEEEVASICGVSMFVRDALWQKLGGFDEQYFAYYEDTDMSLRARLAGWKCVYSPKSSLRHLHCGSGIEFSDYFNKSVAYSHMIFGSKMMNRRQWKEKKAELRALARQQFQFKVDSTLEQKPHLTAYCRYLTRYPYFAKNRIANFFAKPESRLQTFPDHVPRR